MNKSFLVNLFFLISINLLIKPFYILGVERAVQNTLGPETYGLFFALFNFTFIFQIINDFGIQNFNNRLIARHRHLLNRYFSQVLSLKMVLALVYLLIIFVTGRLAGYGAAYDHLIVMIGANQVLVGILLYLRSNISGLGLYRTDSIISGLDKLLMIVFCGILLKVAPFKDHFRIEWFVLAQTIAYLLVIVLALTITLPHLQRVRLKVDLIFWRIIIRQSYPYALVIFLMVLYTRVDAVMIERLLPDGAYEAGVYASGFRLLDALNMIGFLFSGLLLPMFARAIHEGNSIESLLGFSFRLIWAGAISVAGVSFFFQHEIMLLLYQAADVYWGQVMGLLMLTFVAVSGGYIWGSLLTANGSLRQMNGLLLVGVVVNVLLNLVLIPDYKAVGAAVATLVTQFLVLLAQMFLAKKLFQLPYRPYRILQVITFAVLVGLVSYGSYYHLPFDWDVNFGINILACIFLSFLLGMVPVKIPEKFLPEDKMR